VSPEIDDSVKNVLKNTPTEKFDEFVQIATQAADPKNPSVYEKVADTLSDSAKQIDSQTKALNTQKKEILAKAKTGLKEFTKETNQTILELNKVKDSPLAKDFISRLKSVKNKIDADKVIDDLQDMLYTGNRNMTLATGSKEDKILKGILGRYNTKLKDSLPQSYRNINTKISENLNGLNVLNTALGEVVEGVPTRGAGLVKQFFSPAGSKAKELFAFIKQRTGNDIANDAVLAKYIGSAFGDVKVNSLLEGIPSTKSGIIDALTEFTFEKIGAGSALRKAKTEGMIKKARDITLPNK
jgi:vacuolar-type H+-ATPase subunit E/Vma4